jgi:cell division protein FtsW
MALYKKVDPFFVGIISALVIIGLVMFLSGALSLLAKDTAVFTRTLLSHIGLGLVGGGIVWYIIVHTPVALIEKLSPYLFVIGLLVTCAVFVPGIGMSHGGATRWISIAGFSFQPAEFLKIGAIVYTARLLAKSGTMVSNVWGGLIPVVGVIGIVGVTLLAQPDTDTFLLIALSLGTLMLFAGVPWKQLITIALVGIFAMSLVVVARPYLRERLTSFINPSSDPLGASYQLQQSLLAIGSGATFGRGIGQSVQKFGYLPEPMGDSIFAVIGEEVGFVGTSLIVILYLILFVRCMQISLSAKTDYARLVAAGIAMMFVLQALLNMVSNLGLFPFSGLPLVFMSQGGTALLSAIIGYAIVARISYELPMGVRS